MKSRFGLKDLMICGRKLSNAQPNWNAMRTTLRPKAIRLPSKGSSTRRTTSRSSHSCLTKSRSSKMSLYWSKQPGQLTPRSKPFTIMFVCRKSSFVLSTGTLMNGSASGISSHPSFTGSRNYLMWRSSTISRDALKEKHGH